MRTVVANVVLVVMGAVIGMYLGVGQARRYYFRRSCQRVAKMRADSSVGNSIALVELPGALGHHHHLFSKEQ